MPITSAFTLEYCDRPAVTSHISVVQTPVNASGKNSTTVFFLPRLSARLTSTTLPPLRDLSLNSGAFEPTGIAIVLFLFVRSRKAYRAAASGVSNRVSSQKDIPPKTVEEDS